MERDGGIDHTAKLDHDEDGRQGGSRHDPSSHVVKSNFRKSSYVQNRLSPYMPYICYDLAMRKTSVYLTDDEAEELRSVAIATGRSQADLIRDGIQRALLASGVRNRQFHSLAKGHGGGTPYRSWDADDLYRSVMGQE